MEYEVSDEKSAVGRMLVDSVRFDEGGIVDDEAPTSAHCTEAEERLGRQMEEDNRRVCRTL